MLAGPTDCIVEGEVLKLGGPFLQTWQKKHLKLYPNRLEFYHKTRDGQVTRSKGVEVCMCVFMRMFECMIHCVCWQLDRPIYIGIRLSVCPLSGKYLPNH